MAITAPGRPSLAVSSLGVRAAVVVLATVAALLQPSPSPALTVLSAVAALASVSAPAGVGAVPILAVELAAWIYGSDAGADVASWRTALFAVVLYTIHLAVALAAVADVRTNVARPVYLRWLRRAVPGAVAAVAAAVVVAALVTHTESVAVDVIAIAVVGVVVALIVRLGR